MKGKWKQNDIFSAGWFLVLFYYLFIAASNFVYIIPEVKYLKWGVIGFATVLWLAKIRMDKYKKKTLVFIFLAVFVILLAALLSGKELLLITIVFFIATNGIDIERFIKFDSYVRLGIIILIFFLSLIGVLEDSLFIIGDSIKHTFGWLHPNTLASNIVIVMLDYLYLNWKKTKLRNWIIILGVLFFLNKYIAARTSIIGFSLIIVWFIYAHLKKNWKPIKKLVSFIIPNIYIIGAMISFLLVYIYSTYSRFGIILDNLLTHRLRFSLLYLRNYGMSILGQHVDTVSSISARNNGTLYSGVDMSYILLPIQYGLFYSIGFIVVFTFIAYRLYQRKMYRELLFVIYFAIAGFSSNVMLQFYRNFSLIFIWIVINDYPMKNDYFINNRELRIGKL